MVYPRVRQHCCGPHRWTPRFRFILSLHFHHFFCCCLAFATISCICGGSVVDVFDVRFCCCSSHLSPPSPLFLPFPSLVALASGFQHVCTSASVHVRVRVRISHCPSCVDSSWLFNICRGFFVFFFALFYLTHITCIEGIDGSRLCRASRTSSSCCMTSLGILCILLRHERFRAASPSVLLFSCFDFAHGLFRIRVSVCVCVFFLVAAHKYFCRSLDVFEVRL